MPGHAAGRNIGRGTWDAIKALQASTAATPGKEVAYAENTAQAAGWAIPTVQTQVPGMQIVVPAGTPAFQLEFYAANVSITASASPGAAICSFRLEQLLPSAANLGVTTFREQIPVTGQLAVSPIVMRRRMPAATVDTTYQITAIAIYASASALLYATDGSTGAAGPAFLQAVLR